MDIPQNPPPIRTGTSVQPQYTEIPCRYCGRFFSFAGARFVEYFVGSRFRCENCHKRIDLWRSSRDVMRAAPKISHFKLGLVGAVTQYFSVYLDPGETAAIDLNALGVPGDARILVVLYSEANGYRPVEVHASPQPVRYEFPRRYWLHALPDASRRAEVDDMLIAVTSLPAQEASTPIYMLVEAVHRFCIGDYELVPILAHAANEEATRGVVTKALRKALPDTRAEEFVRGVAMRDVYQVLLRIAVRECNAPPLNPYIVGLLESLRRDRNPRAHSASIGPPDRRQLADQLTASVFLLNYVHFVASLLDGHCTYYPAEHPVAIAARLAGSAAATPSGIKADDE